MRRDKDIIGYMYNDTEKAIRDKVIQELESMACEACQMGYGVIDEDGKHKNNCMSYIKAAFALRNKND